MKPKIIISSWKYTGIIKMVLVKILLVRTLNSLSSWVRLFLILHTVLAVLMCKQKVDIDFRLPNSLVSLSNAIVKMVSRSPF